MKNNNLILNGPQLGLSGIVQSWEVINKDGSISRACYKPHSNLITNLGLTNLYWANAYYEWGYNYAWYLNRYLALGTGTAEPTIEDTRLGNEVFRGERNYSAYNADSSSPLGGTDGYYYVTRQRGYQTNLGDLNHDITEVGFATNSTLNHASISTKHRLKDEFGNPTSVRINSDQQLRIKYIISISVTPITSYTGSFELTGYTPSTINYTAAWQGCSGFDSVAGTISIAPQYNKLALASWSPGLGPIGAAGYVNGQIERSYATSSNPVSDGAGGYYTNRTYEYTPSEAVWAGGTQLITIIPSGINGRGAWMLHPSPAIIKPNTHRMTLTIKFSWGRTV